MKRREALRNTLLAAGSTALTPSLLTLLQSCQAEPSLTWKPVFLNPDQARFISTIVDLWLPKTETPGAIDMKVDVFLDLVFARMYDQEAQSRVVAEIDKFNDKCKTKYGNAFVDLGTEEQIELMRSEEAAGGKYNPSVWGTKVGKQEPVGLYRTLKSMALWGYFSSEEIGEGILSYDPVPGVFQGCIPLSDVGNTWSL